MTESSATPCGHRPETAPVLPGDGAEWTPPSWDEVVREHADRVYRLAYRLTGNPHDAEDLTQETFVRVFRSLASYKPGTFEGWLHRITTNLFLDMVRRRARIRMEALPEDTDRLAGRRPGARSRSSPTPTSTRELQAALDELAAGVPRRRRALRRRRSVLRGDRCHARREARYGDGAGSTAGGPRCAARSRSPSRAERVGRRRSEEVTG